MIRSIFLMIALFSLIFCKSVTGQNKENTPNILLITLDDMNWDSPGVYGGIIPDLTPHIDNLAKEGVLFENAYVQAPNCSPSRVVIQTGLYPHQTGMRGFYYVKDNFNTLPEILKDNGYFTGVLNKPADTSISPNFDKYWDDRTSIKGAKKRSAKNYSELLEGFLLKANKKQKPFYCVVNIADPHKPFFNDPSSIKLGFDEFKPSKMYTIKDVKIPEYLPKNARIKKEVLNYYNSVKRGDDCVGEIIKALKSSRMADNTIVILLSDHGAPFHFAKSSVYKNGVKTPLIVSYPSKIKSAIESKSMVSSVDIAPTILEMTGSSIPKELVGKSFYSVLTKKKEKISNYVFAQFDETAGGTPRPSRTVIGKKYGYIFNPWATGSRVFISASTYHATYKTMANMSKVNEDAKKRFDHWKFRTIEELYDYEDDPHALNNLIDNPKYKDVVIELRKQLKIQMIKTNDYVLPAFEDKSNIEYLNKWMQTQIKKADARTKSLRWKRFKNNNGPTKNNSELFNINNAKFN